MSNESEVKEQARKFLAALNDPTTKERKQLLEEAKKQIRGAAEEVYKDVKDSLEKIVIHSEDKAKQPMIAQIPTELKFVDQGIANLTIQCVTQSKLEAEIVQANSSGTGLKVRQDMLNYVAGKTGAKAEDDQADQKAGGAGGIKISKYYFDPSNAIVRFEKRFEKKVK